MSEWLKVQISDIGEVVGGGTPSTKVDEYWDGDIPWITPRDLSSFEGRFIENGKRNISQVGLENSSARLLPKNTILLTSRAPIGYIAIATNKVTTNQGFKSIIPNSKVNKMFLYYLIKNNIDGIKGIASGSTFPEVSGSVLKSFQMKIPADLNEQRSIAEILSSLDDKIDLLNKQNATLEELAQTNFRQWFVENTKGVWEEKGLDQIAYFLNGLPLQNHPYRYGNPLSVIKIREMNNGFSDSSDICQNDIPLKYLVNPGDVVFSWSGSLEIQLWKYGKGALNQHLFKVTSDKYSKWFYYYWIKHYLPDFRSIAESKATTMGHIQRGHISSAKVLIPNDDELVLMNDIMEPLIKKIKSNNIQINTLKSLRDTLLPKLISGEVRVRQ